MKTVETLLEWGPLYIIAMEEYSGQQTAFKKSWGRGERGVLGVNAKKD